MMAFVTATAAVASSSVAIRSFRAHKPSLAPDLDEVGRRSTSCRSGRGRVAPPMAARPRRHPSSSVATRPFRAHKPSLAPDLDEVGRRSTSCRSGRGRAAPPMATRPRHRPSSSVATRPFRAHKPSLAPDLDEVGRRSTSCRSGRGRAAPPRSGRRRGRAAAMGEAGIRCFVAEGPAISQPRAAGGGLVDCVVVGGENSGLCIAQALTTKHRDKAPDVVVTEARDRVGDDHVVRFPSLHRVIFH
ncbi:hypothetical protein NL676_013434 [Syzygium grande]|nr:hypothetical protein NL676_013434 [Syzygium grande]